MIIFYSNELDGQQATLTGDECMHCTKVLRNKEGDTVIVTDGNGASYKGQIFSISKKEVRIVNLVEIESKVRGHKRSIAIAPTKNIDRFEWFLEKSTEIGITDVYPFLSKRSERKVIKPVRLEKILISAMKQSKNYNKPTLHALTSLKNILSMDFGSQTKYIAHCMEPERSLQKLYTSGSDAIVLIGPEGDFTADEIGLAAINEWQEVSLGDSRLRTETAGLVACHLLNL